MRIYAVADIHGNPRKLLQVRSNIDAYNPDVIVVAGDLTRYRGARRVVSALNDLGLPVLAVRGNSDLPGVDRLLRAFPRTESLHLKERVVRGVGFTGVSGAIPVPFRTRIRWIEAPLLHRMDTLLNPETVLVTHPPPWGTLDEVLGRFHAGSRWVRDVVRKRQPRMLLCGHIHERPGTALLGRTLVVNCSAAGGNGGAMIEWGRGKEPSVRIL